VSNVIPIDRAGAAPPSANIPPVNIECEQAFLGSLLMNNEIYGGVSAFLKADHFSQEIHRRIYIIVSVLIDDGRLASPVTVKTFLGDHEIAGATVAQYLARVLADAAPPVSAHHYAREIADLAARREMIEAAQELIAQAADAPAGMKPSAIASGTLDRLGALVDGSAASTRFAASDSIGRLLDRAQAIRNGAGTASGVSTGFEDIDAATSGYRPGELWIVAARPGMGKSIYAVTSANKVARKDHGVLTFSLEVPEEQFAARMAADMAHSGPRPLTFQAILRGQISDEEAWRLEDAHRRISQMPLVVDYSSRLTIADIRARIHAERKRMDAQAKPLAIVFIDYLKFIQATDRYRGNRVYEVGEISAALKQTAKDEKICIVLLAQLNRALEAREDKRPGLSDLRESGDLEADADVVAFLHREAYFIEKSPAYRKGDAEAVAKYDDVKNDAELIIGKNRAGPTRTVNLWCDVSCSTMMSKGRGGFY
jgi:replicative DNA helicase